MRDHQDPPGERQQAFGSEAEIAGADEEWVAVTSATPAQAFAPEEELRRVEQDFDGAGVPTTAGRVRSWWKRLSKRR